MNNEKRADADILYKLRDLVCDRKEHPIEGSYTCYLFEKGLDKILKKIGEESAETIIAAKNGTADELTGEICDLLYHLIVLMSFQNLPLENIMEELERRSQKIGNLKTAHSGDKNT